MMRLNIPNLPTFKMMVESKKIPVFFSARFADFEVENETKDGMIKKRNVTLVLEANDTDTIMTYAESIGDFDLDEKAQKEAVNRHDKRLKQLKQDISADIFEGWYQ